jgi:hypothetical protein
MTTMEKITMDNNNAQGVWDLFNELGRGWQISSGKDCICFDPNDPDEMKDSYSFSRDSFDALKDLSLVQFGEPEEQDHGAKQTVAESLGTTFTISDKGKEWYTEINNLDESERKAKFYELADIEVQ